MSEVNNIHFTLVCMQRLIVQQNWRGKLFPISYENVHINCTRGLKMKLYQRMSLLSPYMLHLVHAYIYPEQNKLCLFLVPLMAH